jgi:uncharacterized membrane protein
MKKLNKLSVIILIGAVLSLVINLIFYNKLPNQVGMQVTTSGNLNNFVPKIVFIFITPAFLIADLIYSTVAEKIASGKALVVGIIIFAANIFIMLKNLA